MANGTGSGLYGSAGECGPIMSGDQSDWKQQQSGTTTELQLSGEVKGSVLSCHNICYDVYVKNKACCGKLEPKRILTNIE